MKSWSYLQNNNDPTHKSTANGKAGFTVEAPVNQMEAVTPEASAITATAASTHIDEKAPVPPAEADSMLQPLPPQGGIDLTNSTIANPLNLYHNVPNATSLLFPPLNSEDSQPPERKISSSAFDKTRSDDDRVAVDAHGGTPSHVYTAVNTTIGGDATAHPPALTQTTLTPDDTSRSSRVFSGDNSAESIQNTNKVGLKPVSRFSQMMIVPPNGSSSHGNHGDDDVMQDDRIPVSFNQSLPPASAKKPTHRPNKVAVTTTPAVTQDNPASSHKKSKHSPSPEPLGKPVGTTPSDRDILCGRGRGFFQHPGNRRMLAFVKGNKMRYKNANKKEKAEIVEEVVALVHGTGGRFLKRSGDPNDPCWYIASTDEKYRKICHCLREEKHNSDVTTLTSRTSQVSQVDTKEPAAAKGMTKSVATIYDQWKEAISNTVNATTPAASVPMDDDQDKYADAPEEPTTTMNSVAEAAPATSNNHLDILAGTALALKLDSITYGELQGFAMSPAPPKQMELALSMPPKLVGAPVPTAPKLALAPPTAPFRGGLERQQYAPHAPKSNHQRQPGHASPLTGPQTVDQARIPTGSTSLFMKPSNGQPVRQILGDEGLGIMIGDPNSSDILFGQDPAFFHHPGNVQLRQLIEATVGFLPLNVQNKVALSRRIVSEITQHGAKFLTRQATSPDGIWYRIDQQEAEVLILRCLEEEATKKFSLLIRDRENALNALRRQALGPTTAKGAAVPVCTTAAPGSSAACAASALGNREQEKTAERLRLSQAPGRTHDQPVVAVRASHALESMPPLVSGAGKVSTHDTEDESYSESDSEDSAVMGLDTSMYDDSKGISGESSPFPEGSEAEVADVGPYDVICGRGRGNFRHEGNRRMLAMFWNVKERYNGGSKKEKTQIGRAIVDDIQRNGGRFLRRAHGRWEVMDDKTILRKVCHGIRDVPNDPEMRKRSVVADDLESLEGQAHGPDKGIAPNYLGRHAAPWLASGAKPLKPKVKRVRVDHHNAKPKKMKSSPSPTATIVAMPSEDGTAAGELNIVEKPDGSDILCGRGRGYCCKAGNQYLQKIISENAPRYDRASKPDKAALIQEVLSDISKTGARFLKRRPDGRWETVGGSEIRSKICQGIRDFLNNCSAKARGGLVPQDAMRQQVDVVPDFETVGPDASAREHRLEAKSLSVAPSKESSPRTLNLIMAARQQAEAETAAMGVSSRMATSVVVEPKASNPLLVPPPVATAAIRPPWLSHGPVSVQSILRISD